MGASSAYARLVGDDLDIDEERRRYVDDMFARLGALTHYEALGLAPTADKKEIKRAYFHLVGVVHPDRFFGKKLGPYKPRLEAVFARITTAYETLADRDRRAAYDGTIPGTGAGAPPSSARMPAARPAPVDPETAAKRKAAMEALQARFAEAGGKATTLSESAARARAAGDLGAAVAAYQQALVYAPNDAALRAAFDETSRLAADKLVASHAAKAAIAEKLGQWAQAAEAWRKVVEARPDDVAARARLAAASSRAGAG